MKPTILNKSIFRVIGVLFAVIPFVGLGQTYNTNNIYGAGTTSFTVPCGVTQIYVQVFGGGGGGGRANGATGGSGGGGGGYTFATLTVTPGTTYSIVVGAGGCAGGSGGCAGNGTGGGGTGGTSNFGSGTLIGVGGVGGQQSGGSVGTGGSASGGSPVSGTSGTIGTITYGGGGGDNGNGNGGADNSTVVDVSLSGGTGGGGAGGLDGPDGGSTTDGGVGGDGRIIVSFNGPNAGLNQNLACGATTTTLAGNAPAGTAAGAWTVFAGTATITTPSSATSGVTGLVAGACATLRWTWTGGGVGCISTFNDTYICVDASASCNDNPCGAITLTATGTSCSPTTINNNGGTPSYNVIEPGCNSYSSTLTEDIWYSVTVPASGDLIIIAADVAGGAAMVPAIALYTGTSCSNLTHQGCYGATVNYTGTPGETVYIRVWDFSDAEDQMTICAYTSSNAGEGTIMPGNNTFTCGSSGTGIFVDPGGSSNYANAISNSYTICPSTAGSYVSVNFTSFSLGTGDALVVINGTNGDAIIGNFTGATSPGTITSSDASGCLTFWFTSNASTVSTGWVANVSCTTIGTNNNNTYVTSGNCNGGGGLWACQDGGYPTQNAGPTGVEDLGETTTGCWGANGEISSTWFYFQPTTSGTLEMTFDGPSGMDYDFAVYGPTTNYTIPCPMGTGDGPIRCSYSAASNPVGIGNGAEDFFEDASGDGWIAGINVTVGQTYAMVFNIFQMGNPQPTINIAFSGTAILDCTPFITLPSTLVSFEGINQNETNLLSWITASEMNNDYFTLHRSINGIDWENVGRVDGAGTTDESRYYTLRDINPYFPVSYYRLQQTDLDGQSSFSDIISINTIDYYGTELISQLFPNPTSEYATFVYNGNDTETPLQVNIINEMGQIVQDYTFLSIYKNMPTTLRTFNLAEGMYQVVFTQGDQRQVQKLAIIRK